MGFGRCFRNKGTSIRPKVRVIVYPEGIEGIETVDAANHPNRTLGDLPVI
jgi:hypothetical protein